MKSIVGSCNCYAMGPSPRGEQMSELGTILWLSVLSASLVLSQCNVLMCASGGFAIRTLKYGHGLLHALVNQQI